MVGYGDQVMTGRRQREIQVINVLKFLQSKTRENVELLERKLKLKKTHVPQNQQIATPKSLLNPS